MSTAITDAGKLWMVERSTLARGTTTATRQALASPGTPRCVTRDKRLFRHTEPAATIALLGTGHVRVCHPVGPRSREPGGYCELSAGMGVKSETARARAGAEL